MTTSPFPESHLDLLQAPGVAILSTVAPGGAVQSTAVWYLLDGGELKLSLSGARKKLRNLQADAHATLFILDPANQFRFIEIRGTTTIVADPDYSFRAKVGGQYGVDTSTFDPPGATRFVVTLHPTRINAR